MLMEMGRVGKGEICSLELEERARFRVVASKLDDRMQIAWYFRQLSHRSEPSENVHCSFGIRESTGKDWLDNALFSYAACTSCKDLGSCWMLQSTDGFSQDLHDPTVNGDGGRDH
jgi:hypothetical protein